MGTRVFTCSLALMAAAAEPVESKRPRRITKELASFVLSLHAFFRDEKACECGARQISAVKRTSLATNLSISAVRKIRRCGIDSFPPASERETREREVSVSAEWELVIKHTISERYQARQPVTLDALLAHLKSCEPPGIEGPFVACRSTLWRTLQRMGYKCSTSPGQYAILRTKSSVVGQRIKYIQQIQQLRSEGRPIFYQDETWFNKNMVPPKQWLDEDGKGGRPAPSGKGSRFIISQIGSRVTGLVPAVGLCLLVDYNKASEDYHKCMNGEMFLTWIRDKVLPYLVTHHPSAVLVLDQASYHRTLTEDTRPSWKKLRKQQLVDFLLDRGVPASVLPPLVECKLTELRDLAVTVVGDPVYEVVHLAAAQGITVVYLPVAHPELNPIETIWAFSKARVASKNGLNTDKPFTMTHLKTLVEEAFGLMGPSTWCKAEARCLIQEDFYLEQADIEDSLDEDEEEEEEDVDGLSF